MGSGAAGQRVSESAGRRVSGSAALAGLVPDGLQVEDLGYLEPGRHHPLAVRSYHGAHADARREVAHASVQLRDEGDRAEVERGRVDEDGRGLPLLGRKPGRIRQGRGLRCQGLLGGNLAVDHNDPLDLLAGQALNLRQMLFGEGGRS